MRAVLTVLCVSVLGVAASSAVASPRVVLAPVYAEPDLIDEAGAVGLLIRNAFDRDKVVAIEVVARGTRPTLDRASEVLRTTGGELIVLAAIDRLGPTLVISAQVVDRQGGVVGKAIAQAPDGG